MIKTIGQAESNAILSRTCDFFVEISDLGEQRDYTLELLFVIPSSEMWRDHRDAYIALYDQEMNRST